MRAAARDLLLANGVLTAFIPTERWFQVGSVIDVPRKPFAILRWITPVAGDAKGTYAKQLRVELYDNRGGYGPIDAALKEIYGVFANAAGVTGVDGYIAQMDSLGDSGDDVHVEYKANFKYSSWQVIGRSF